MDAIVKSAVIDASVGLKWSFGDEEAVEQARALLRDHARGSLRLFVPPLFDYEVLNALRTAVHRGRITEEQALATLSELEAILIERPPFRDTQSLTLRLALQYQCAVYDSAYLALAQANTTWFFTGDRKLYNAVSAQLPWVKWIGDYAFDAIPTPAR